MCHPPSWDDATFTYILQRYFVPRVSYSWSELLFQIGVLLSLKSSHTIHSKLLHIQCHATLAWHHRYVMLTNFIIDLWSLRYTWSCNWDCQFLMKVFLVRMCLSCFIFSTIKIMTSFSYSFTKKCTLMHNLVLRNLNNIENGRKFGCNVLYGTIFYQLFF